MAFPQESNVMRSMEIYQRAGQLIPGHTQLIGRRASHFATGVSPIYARYAKGARFVDIDGNEFIDWISAFGANILGYADEVVDRAVAKQIRQGSISSLSSPLEIELAEELVQTIPCAEMVRYTKGGGEACAMAVRIARGVTGRDEVLFCGYHGWHDWYQAGHFLTNSETGVEPIGVPAALAGTAIGFQQGDAEMLKCLLESEEHRGQVACIMMEPIRSQWPPTGYLEAVRELASAHDVVLIFDEVTSGWRSALGGAQEYLGITPDMAVFAKGMSNGYPMGVVVGKCDVMAPAKDMFISSSYWSDTIGLVASLTTIRELRRRCAPERFREIGEALRVALNQAFETVGLRGRCTGLHTYLGLEIDLPDEDLRRAVSTLYTQEMARRGIHVLMGSHVPCLAHTLEDIRLTAEAAMEVFSVIKEALSAGDVVSLLSADVSSEPFQRLVR